MQKIKVTFLGTATSIGVPVIACNCKVCVSENPKDKRFRSSVLIESGNQTFAIDCGPDFRQQMLQNKVEKIDAILLTHEHRDHVAGLDDVRGFNYSLRKSIPVYCEQRVIENLKKDFSYIFAEKKYSGVPELSLNTINEQNFSIGGAEFIPIRVMHHKLGILGFRMGDFAYITDGSHIANEELSKLSDLKVLVLNALRQTSHFSHFSLEEAIAIIDKVKPEKAYLTHISHLLGKHDDVNKTLPPNVCLAYDGLVLEI
jgi:phosphoribosyl 1,2-cyclic phosphate phosphodiesterase